MHTQTGFKCTWLGIYSPEKWVDDNRFFRCLIHCECSLFMLQNWKFYSNIDINKLIEVLAMKNPSAKFIEKNAFGSMCMVFIYKHL